MGNYISFLRGINVGGKNKILMKDLKNLYQSLSFKQISTYIQTGNVFFSSNLKKIDAKNIIEKAIHSNYGFKVPCILKNEKEMLDLVDNNPFHSPKIDTKRLFVTFLENQPSEENIRKLINISFQKDQLAILNNLKKIVYLNFDASIRKSKLDNNYIEKILLSKATTRNWNTVIKTKERLISSS